MRRITLPISADTLYNSRWYDGNQLTTESVSITIPDRIITLLSTSDRERQFTPREAARTGDPNLVLWVLALEVNTEGFGSEKETALIHAVRNHHQVIARILLKTCADINFVDGASLTPLSHAVRSSHEEVVAILLDQGALCYSRNDTFTIYAAFPYFFSIIECAVP